MTREELKVRCEALAAVGDEQARCTLGVLKELELLQVRCATDSSAQSVAQLDHAMYTLNKIAKTIELARSLLPLDRPVMNSSPVRADEFVGVKVNGKVVDGIEPRPRAIVPPPRSLCNDPAVRDEVTTQEATPEQSQRIGAIAKAFGIAPAGPEAVAAAATRAANALPAVPDAGATQATPNIQRVTEKVPGGTKAEGNKE